MHGQQNIQNSDSMAQYFWKREFRISPGQEMTCVFGNSQVHFCVHKKLPLTATLSK